MTVEAPESIHRGEQVGLRLDIFNNWDRDLEVNVLFDSIYHANLCSNARLS